MKTFQYRPIRNWDEVFECIDQIVADPRANVELIRILNINLRVETGSLAGYQGSGFAERADSIGLSKKMRQKLEELMGIDLSQDEMYLLVRQLVKSLPFFGASQDEIRTLRSLAEEIEYSFPCPITEDIRGEIHSKLSPRNLDLVRALLSYAEKGDAEPLKKANKYQKVLQYTPKTFKGLLKLLSELERELANVFEPHPGNIEDRIDDIQQVLSNISQIVSPSVNNQLRYLLGSLENRNRSLIQTNVGILTTLLDDAVRTAEDGNYRVLFEKLKEGLSGAENLNPEEVVAVIGQWRRDAVSLFFPGLIDSLENLIAHLRSRDALAATLVLGDIRVLLRQRITHPLPQSQTNAMTLEAIWLDLTLERIGYTLFGEVSNVVLADITTDTLPVAIDVTRSMIKSVWAKGQGTPRLEACDIELRTIKQSGEWDFYTIYSVAERINAEIGTIIDRTVGLYYDIALGVIASRQIPNAEEAASAFVDGLFRSTTLQHLSELTLKLSGFSRRGTGELMKRLPQPRIREISPAKLARINRDMEAIAGRNEPARLACHFRPGEAEGSLAEYPILGEKGAYLAEMARLGLQVPPGFTLTSKVCDFFFSDGRVLRQASQELLLDCLNRLEQVTGRVLGCPERPLLLSVRGGSCVSMPGMLDTVLNVGFNRETTEGMGRVTGNPVFAYTCYYSLITKYAASVLGFTPDKSLLLGEDDPARASAALMQQKVERLLEAVKTATGRPFPQDPHEQLMGAVKAVFDSWHSESVIAYRQIFNIPNFFGTAATVQQMVFGNIDEDSCSGVVFSRNPVTGDRRIFGEYLPGSQGEVLVGGQGKPLPLSAADSERLSDRSLETRHPERYRELEAVVRRIELRLADMQDVEFTIEKGVLYLLQTRPAKRTGHAALKVAVDLVAEGVINKGLAVARLDEFGLQQLLLPIFSPDAPKRLIAKGNPASPGVASGRPAFSGRDAIRRAHAGQNIIFVTRRSTPNDIGSIAAAQGVLAREGGMTSHAAINSRRMAKPCVTGCEELEIDDQAQRLRVGSVEIGPEDTISVDGYTGGVFLGEIEILNPERPRLDSDRERLELDKYFNAYLEWKRDAPTHSDPEAK
jgi:phosphohistidine swiveling domain-containing protein